MTFLISPKALSPDHVPQRENPTYPTPVRGITLGRCCVIFGLAPPRPIIPPGIPPPAPPPPIGIGIIGIPPPVAPAACAISAGIAPSPRIAELPIPAGVEPCQVGGTDIAPTNRALPRPADIPAPRPPAPPRPFIAGATSPTNFGASTNPAAAAPNPPVPAFAPCINDIIGDIIMLTGIAPTCATDANDDSGNAEAADWTPLTNPGSATAAPSTTGDTAAVAADANPVTCDAHPARSTGGTLKGVNVDATDVAPA
jgi:hypothetical protein